MTKQTVEVKLSLCCQKSRRKALKTAVAISGVQSVELDGDKLVVTGNGTDAVCLATQLRKKLGYADLISVTTGVEEKENENKPQEETEIVQPLNYQYQYQYQYQYYADLISITTGAEEKENENKPQEETEIVQPLNYQYQYSYPYHQYTHYQTAYDYPKWYNIF